MSQTPSEGPSLTRPILFFFAVLVAFIVAQGLIVTLPIDPRVAVIATQIVVILGGALLYRAKFSRPDTDWPALRRLGMSPLALVVVLVASVSLGLLANALGALTIQIFPNLMPMAEQYHAEIERLLLPETLSAQIMGAIAVAVVAPIAEEVMFRGTLLPEQRRSQITVNALLLNGLLFSAMHLNPVALLSLAVVGAYFAHITLRSGALWGAILGHAVLNLVNGVILLRVAGEVASPAAVGWTEVLMALAILVPLTAGLWWWSIRLIGAGQSAEEPAGQ